jgi:hypothetical protein
MGILLLVLPAVVSAQAIGDIGDFLNSTSPSVGMSFLKIGMGARAVSLGGAYSSLVRDPTAVYWNPAAVVYSKGIDFNFSHLMLMEGVRYEFFALSTGDGKQGIGVGMGGVFYGDMELRGETPSQDPIGMFTAYSFLIKLSYGRSFGNDLVAGTSVTGILEKIYVYSTRAYAFDVGMRYQLPIARPLCVSLNVMNLGPKILYEKETYRLPLTGRLGSSYSVKRGRVVITGVAEVSKSIDAPLASGIGIETEISWLSLRGGYRYHEKNVLSWSAGLGIRYRFLSIDYSLSPYGMDLGKKHCISLNVDL